MAKQYEFPELVFDISDLYRGNGNISNEYKIDLKLPFIDQEGRWIPKSTLKGAVQLFRTGESIECNFKDISLDVEIHCHKCLEPYIRKIQIENTERTFYLEEEEKEVEEDMCIDKKRLLLDANEMLRQEIILHFPFVLVCSESCEGICEHCGQNKKDKKCMCKPIELDERKPLAALKKMWNSNR